VKNSLGTLRVVGPDPLVNVKQIQEFDSDGVPVQSLKKVSAKSQKQM
jgi:hypothetical protein